MAQTNHQNKVPVKGTIEKLIETDDDVEAGVRTVDGDLKPVSVGKFSLCLPEWGEDGFNDRLRDYRKGSYSHPPIIVGDEVNFEEVNGELTITEILFKPNDPRKIA